MIRSSSPALSPVCVLGDVDLVRALGLAGIRSVVVAADDDPVRYSRHVIATLPRLDHWTEGDRIAAELSAWAGGQVETPVLLAQTDGDLLLVSRHRAQLAGAFRFLVPDATLVEDLVDKERFQRLAQRLDLDVPRAATLASVGSPRIPSGLRPPLIVKPLTRRGLVDVDEHGKAVRIDSQSQLDALWTRTSARGVDLLLQELVPGPESRIESWHAYVDAAGAVVGEFCGEKIRTWPPQYGHSTALRITSTADVARAGAAVVDRLNLQGLVKVDFKRDPMGALRLLEVNPRATLWHHPGAVAGVNLAALVYADLTGRPRPPQRAATAGVTWCAPREDRWAARATGVPTAVWVSQTLRCGARSGASWGDPGPFLRGELVPALARRLRPRGRAARLPSERLSRSAASAEQTPSAPGTAIQPP